MFQLVAVGPHSMVVHLRAESSSIFSLHCNPVAADSNKVSLLPFFFQPGQTQLSQLLLTYHVLQPWLDWWPSIGLMAVRQYLSCTRVPKTGLNALTAVSQVLYRGEHRSSRAAGCSFANAALDAVGSLLEGRMAGWRQLVHQDPQILFYRAAAYTVGPQPVSLASHRWQYIHHFSNYQY